MQQTSPAEQGNTRSHDLRTCTSMHNCPPDKSASSCFESAANALCLSFWLSQHVGQVWNESNAEDKVLVMVVRTGLCTTMGNMLRQVTNPLHNTQLYKDPFLRVSQLL